MIFEEVKAEAMRYKLDPDTEVVVEWRMHRGRSDDVVLGLRVRRPSLHHPERRDWIYNTELHDLENLSPALIREVIEYRWITLWHHELQEWMTKDGEHLHDPHDVRKELTE